MATIRDLIRSDFMTVFPTIIGDEPHKLSIEDIMDTSHDFIINEIQELKEVNQDEKEELISFLKLVNVAEDGVYDSQIHFRLKRFTEKHPDQKSFKVFLYSYLFECHSNSDLSIDHLILLYQKIFETEMELMQLTDFISETGFGHAALMLTEVPDDLITVFRGGILAFPGKINLIYILAQLFMVQGNYALALRYTKLFLSQLETHRKYDIDTDTYIYDKESLDFDFIDDESMQLTLYHAADLNYKLENYEESLEFCNRLLDKYDNGSKDKSDPCFVLDMDTLIIRIQNFMKIGNIEGFKKDYRMLLEYTPEDELRENYKDLIYYASLVF
jgi:tetratricopeptide (TPR) repeat protein